MIEDNSEYLQVQYLICCCTYDNFLLKINFGDDCEIFILRLFTRLADDQEVWKFVIVVFLLLPEFGPVLNDEVVKETHSVFCSTFLDAFREGHEKSV